MRVHQKYMNKITSLFLFVIIVFFSAWLKLQGIAEQSIWFDEGWSAFAAAQPDIISAANADATNPPLYYALIYLASRLWGDSEFGLRFFSLLLSLPLIPLAYQLARRLSPVRYRQRSGLIAALFVGISPLMWWASQEARMYTLLALLLLVIVFAWHRLLTASGALARRAWVALLTAELLFLYAHNTAPVIVIWLNLITLWVFLTNSAWRARQWRYWLGGQVIVMLLWSPYFVTRFLSLSDANSAIMSAPQLNFEQLRIIWMSFWVVPYERVTDAFDAPYLFLALLAFYALLGGIVGRRARWAWVHVLILTGGLVAALIVLGNQLHGRYLVMLAPLLMVGFALGIAKLPRLAAFSMMSILVLVCGWALFSARDPDLPYRHDDARAITQYYADHLTNDDTVLAWSYADRYELAYYWDRLGVAAERVTLPEGADLESILGLLPTSGDVALNVWYTQRADYRGMMGCLLANGTSGMPQTFTTYGMTTDIYHNPQLTLASFNAVDVRFADIHGEIAQLRQIGALSASAASQALCVPLEFSLSRAVDVNLRAALIVRNSFGWEIARADAIIATADQRESASVEVGELLRAFATLRLPFGAPAGDYAVYLRLYDETVELSGYTPATGVLVSGRDMLIGQWQVGAGAWLATVDTPTQPIVTSETLELIHANLPPEETTLHNGDVTRLALLWRGNGTLPTLTLQSVDGAWSLDIPPHVPANPDFMLDWREIRIPPDAASGEVLLTLPNGEILGRYTLESLPMLLDAPQVDHAVNRLFPAVGELVGYTLDEPLSLESAPQITLLWRALPDSEILVSYTVFVQLIGEQGQVIAQSDSIPVSGTRPTTGWRGGEYVIDPHTLTYNDLALAGEAQLIVGLYDAATNQRLEIAEGIDFVSLGTLEIR